MINKYKNKLNHIINTLFFKQEIKEPIYIFSHHKCGTKLLEKIFKKISIDFGLKYISIYGSKTIDYDADIIFFFHSQIENIKLPKKFRGIHIIRDPRDVIISGYLYHKRTNEDWCINENFNFDNPIRYPIIPYSQEYRSENWKKEYLLNLNNKSYQANLNEKKQTEGIIFEIKNYGSWTIEDMMKWNYKHPNIKEIKFEVIMKSYNDIFYEIFEHFRFNEQQIKQALKIANKHDLNRMSRIQIKKNPHIFSKKTSKWKKYFNKEISDLFNNRFKNVLSTLKYENN